MAAPVATVYAPMATSSSPPLGRGLCSHKGWGWASRQYPQEQCLSLGKVNISSEGRSNFCTGKRSHKQSCSFKRDRRPPQAKQCQTVYKGFAHPSAQVAGEGERAGAWEAHLGSRILWLQATYSIEQKHQECRSCLSTGTIA